MIGRSATGLIVQMDDLGNDRSEWDLQPHRGIIKKLGWAIGRIIISCRRVNEYFVLVGSERRSLKRIILPICKHRLQTGNNILVRRRRRHINKGSDRRIIQTEALNEHENKGRDSSRGYRIYPTRDPNETIPMQVLGM